MTNLDSILKSRDITVPTKVHITKAMCFSSGCIWMWELDHKEALKNWCFWTVVLEKTLESPVDCKEIKPDNPKGNQPWIFMRRTDAQVYSNTLATWCEELTHLKRPWCWQRVKVGGEGDNREWDGWMASLNGQAFEQTHGDSEEQGSLMFCSSWGHKESDTT